MKIGILCEAKQSHDHRVALIPKHVGQLVKERDCTVLLEANAGLEAGYSDNDYQAEGAIVISDAKQLFSESDVIVSMSSIGIDGHNSNNTQKFMHPNQTLISMFDALYNPKPFENISQSINVFSLDLMPRITGAQGMDVLSSMATVEGYKAVLLSAQHCQKFFPMMMTAAGTIQAANVYVIGAGVAGLQAVATARRMGANVFAFDVRAAVKEQIESLGAQFIELPMPEEPAEDERGYAKAQSDDFNRKQQRFLLEHLRDADVIITTALIPGMPAPILISETMVNALQPGTIVVDLAARHGGNCALIQLDEVVETEHGVKIFGYANLASLLPQTASQMYSQNMLNFLLYLIDERGDLRVDAEDEIVKDTLVLKSGKLVQPRVLAALQNLQ